MIPTVINSAPSKKRVNTRHTKNNVQLGYDIFKKLKDGTPLWVTHTETLAEAEKTMEALRRAVPAEYFARDARTGSILRNENDGRG